MLTIPRITPGLTGTAEIVVAPEHTAPFVGSGRIAVPATPVMINLCSRRPRLLFSPYLYRARNLVERFFNKIKHCRRFATRYDKLAANYLASFNSRRSGYGCA
jgi:hypothetical protein